MRSRPSGVFNTTRQMAAAFAGFVAVILLAESGGLAVWAERLEIGPLRTVAVRVTSAWHNAARPLGIEHLRETAIASLQKVGWSDDAVLVAEAAKPGPPVVPGPGNSGEAPVRKAGEPRAPLAASVPRSTTLAPLPAPPNGRARVIALAGDSMMTVGLSAVLLRQTANRKDLQIVKAFRSGTGLARPEVFNWLDQYPAMLNSAQPDVVIVAIGANDGQGFVERGEVLKFGSENWIEVYRQRLSAFLDMLSAGGARIIWIGLPPMKQETYNQKIAEINRIAYTEVGGCSNASWFNSTPYVGDAAGNFREFLTTSDGKTIRIRASDGIHLSDEGAALVTSELMRWLDERTKTGSLP